ncbi:MAG TPA: hypothetical protein VK620_12175 [Bradyrhizobium sp.]|nr:hypothetical protein [Bradyrhizobium sp.]
MAHFIDSAMARGGLTDFAQVDADVRAGRMLLWIAIDERANLKAAAVTELAVIQGRKVGTIVACGGHGLKDFAGFIAELENHFRAEGCVASRILGRKGWARIYPDYRVRSIVMEKAL